MRIVMSWLNILGQYLAPYKLPITCRFIQAFGSYRRLKHTGKQNKTKKQTNKKNKQTNKTTTTNKKNKNKKKKNTPPKKTNKQTNNKTNKQTKTPST